MSQMIERAARHVFDRIQERSPTAGATFDNAYPAAQEEMRQLVRWVIEAMQDPPESMLDAVEERCDEPLIAESVWAVMIDAALK